MDEQIWSAPAERSGDGAVDREFSAKAQYKFTPNEQTPVNPTLFRSEMFTGSNSVGVAHGYFNFTLSG